MVVIAIPSICKYFEMIRGFFRFFRLIPKYLYYLCRQYPNCNVPIPSEIGNNICNENFNIEDCGFDGGDVSLLCI